MGIQALKLATATLLGLFLAGCPGAPAGTRYFLVAEGLYAPHGDSFVLPLSDPADIAHAKALIRNPDRAGAPIVVAKIAEGSSDGAYTNRDLLGGGAPWSWHVSEFLDFSDFTIEIYDGWPGYVEDNYDEYVSNTNGIIGFWSYTIVREVAPCELDQTCAARFDEFPPHSPLAH